MRAIFRMDMSLDYTLPCSEAGPQAADAAPPSPATPPLDMAAAHPHHPFAFRFCPVCGGALELKPLKSGEPERPVCVACGFVFYLDPKVAVGAIIRTTGDRLVLVRRAIEPGYGKWVFPGGYVDRGERIEAAAIREAREECGLEIRLERLLNIYSYTGRTPIIIVYVATAVGGTLAVDDEGLEIGEFDRADIPWSALAFSSTRDALRDYFDGVTSNER